jgi:BASS family bile acid:Na+ symporter
MHDWFRMAPLILQISVMVQVFAIGLGSSWQQAMFLFRRPKLLANSILARNVVMPIVAIMLIKAFSFHVAVAITLGVLAVTPVPPLLPRSQLKGGERAEYVLGLLVSQAVLAIVLVPVTMELMNWALRWQAFFSASQVASLVFRTILIPLALGILGARVLPRLQEFSPPVLAVGTVLLIVGAAPLLFLAFKMLGELAGEGAILALVIFIAAGIAAGHLLGGPLAADRKTLAVASSARHPGLALAIVVANFPDQKLLVAGCVVIYLILDVVLSVPYKRWWWHAPAEPPQSPAPPVLPSGFAGRPRRGAA